MTEKKRGRPKKEDTTIWAWDKKYYKPSGKQDDHAKQKVKEERLHKAYSHLWFLAFGEPKTTRDLGKINKAVAGIINAI